MDDAVAELYAVEPGEFVNARDELARRLKSEGEGERAAAVKKLRRPTVAAWGVNLLARRRPEQVAALLAAGERLRAAHEGALQGADADELREAMRGRRDAMADASASAVELLSGAGRRGEPHADDVTAILEAALRDPAVADAVRAGAVSGPVPEESDLIAGLEPIAAGVTPAENDAEPAAPKEPRVSGRVASARRALADARAERERLEDEARSLSAAAAEAESEAERAESRVRQLEEELITASQDARLRRRAADRARHEEKTGARAAASAADRAEKAVERLERAEEEATGDG